MGASNSQDARKGVADTPAIQEKRKNIFNEIVTSERRYVGGLEVMINVYMKPMEAKGIMNEKTLRQIFSVSENLMLFHQTFLVTLEKSLKEWGPETLVGDHFLRIKPFFKMYFDYVNNYAAATSVLKEQMEKKKVAKYLENPFEEEKECKYPDWGSYGGLASLLITPVQRLPRYNLLLDEFIKKTPDNHPDLRRLQEALTAMKQATESVNESKRTAEDQTALLRIDEELNGKCKGLIVAHRRYVMQDEVGFLEVDETKMEKTSLKEKKGMFYLFSDIVVVASKESGLLGGKPKLKYLWKLPLSRIEISDSKQAYPQRDGGGSKIQTQMHPIRFVVDQTGCNPECMFHIRLIPPGKSSDALLESVKSTRDLSIEDAPMALSLAVVAPNIDVRKKWVDKLKDEQAVVLGKEKAREDAIKKYESKRNLHNNSPFVFCTCADRRPGKSYLELEIEEEEAGRQRRAKKRKHTEKKLAKEKEKEEAQKEREIQAKEREIQEKTQEQPEQEKEKASDQEKQKEEEEEEIVKDEREKKEIDK